MRLDRSALIAVTIFALVGVLRGADLETQSADSSSLVERIPEATVLHLDVDPTPGRALTLEVPIQGIPSTIDLAPHSVRSPRYQVLAQGHDGSLVPQEPGPVRTLRGVVIERPGSFVAASLVEHGIEAMLDLPDVDGRVWIQPAPERGPGAHVLYHDEQVPGAGAVCGTTGARGAGEEQAPSAQHGSAGGGIAGIDCVSFADLACDADYEYFQVWSASVSNVESQINSIVNVLNDQYRQDVGISHRLTTIIVRTTPGDPYSSTTNHASLLSEFRFHWNTGHGGVIRDVAQLFTGRDFAENVIGVAYTGNICTPSAYSVVQQISAFSCRTDLSAHELGHNWGANHCGCSEFTMNAILSCGNQFSPEATIPEIVAYRGTRTCLDVTCAPLPNDECENAIDLGDGEHFFATLGATTGGPPDDGCGASPLEEDIWFSYVPRCGGPVLIDLCGSDFDTRLAVYGPTCPGEGPPLACSDDACGAASFVAVAAEAGDRLLIRVGGDGDAQGSGTLTIRGPTCPDCPTDTDGDGDTDVDDLIAVILDWGTAGSSNNGDVDASGQVDVNDLVAVILAWGPCDG